MMGAQKWYQKDPPWAHRPSLNSCVLFTMLAEEFGLAGGIALLLLYFILMAHGTVLSLRCNSQFGRMIGMGIVTTFFLYVFINKVLLGKCSG